MVSHVRFGQPIRMEDYLGQFMSGEEGAPRAAVKRLTAVIERELTQSTINAPDWSVGSVPWLFLDTDAGLVLLQGTPFTLLGWRETSCGQMNGLLTLMTS